jgi:sugar lactone lactonase YvrE
MKTGGCKRMRLINKAFTTLIIASLGTILVCISVHAGALAFDASGNLFAVDGSTHSIFKFTPDGTRSTFATAFKNAGNLIFDSKGDLFASDYGQKSIFKFTPGRKQEHLGHSDQGFRHGH